MQILFDLNPSNLSLLNSLDPQSFIDMIQMTSPVPVSGYTVINNNDGTFSVTIDYAGDIHGQNISIEITFDSIISFYKSKSSFTF